MTSTPTGPRRPPSPLRRYAPFLVVLFVAGVVVVAVALAGGGGDGGDGRDRGPSGATAGAGPVIFSEENKDRIDWGPRCDTQRGRVALPLVTALPCVKPHTGDNGGATAPGVTADAIKVVVYQGDPSKNPLQSALVRSAGADVDLATGKETALNYIRLLERYHETYGRRIDVEFFTGTGAPNDEVTARADARAIADKRPFAVLGGPGQTPVFAEELAANKILCLGGCALATPEKTLRRYAPYLWGNGPTPEQASTLTTEMIANLLAGKKARWAGSEAFRNRTRVFGAVHYDTPDGQQTEAFAFFRRSLERKGVKLAADIPFFLDIARGQENARTMIAKLKSAGVTSVIYYGDPLTPSFLTQEATAQDYFPEWIIGPNVFADTAVFGRTYDQRQWRHAFGVSLIAARGTQDTSSSRNLYIWGYGEPPPNNTYAVILGDIVPLFTGVHLAGPTLTPQTFRDGLFRAPPRRGTPLIPSTSRGRHGIWPGVDLGGSDDATLIWWDPEAQGEDEIGNTGKGLYVFVDGGKRYRPGEWPKTDPGLFDRSKGITIYEEIPAEDRPPRYPSPAQR